MSSDAADPTTTWTALIRRYYDGCSSGDVDLMLQTLHPDVVHWFLAPNTGSAPVAGAEHLARYWRKVAGRGQARWVVDSICATGDRAVIEWTMWWLPPDATERVATRGAEWFEGEDGLIREIRSYYQLRPETTELDGFPYGERGYSVAGAERSDVHPDAYRYGPVGTR
jgi:ketosteroid isomerase-like protein